MSLTGTAGGVTAGDLLNLQAGIQGFLNTAEATAEAALIQAGKDTVRAYATRLEIANTGQSETVMATISLMQNPPGGVPTAGKLLSPTSFANEFQHLIVDYLPAQQAFAVANKLNITVYNGQVLGLGTGAGGDGTQNNFLKNWGSAALTLSQFETSLSQLTNVTVGAIDAQYQFFVKLYGAAPVNLPAGYANADAAARAVTFGFAVGTDMDNPTLNPALIAEVENAKELNALTINGDVAGASGYQTNVALALQPIAPPLQGVAGPPTSLVLTIGVDTPTMGFTTGKGATATVAGQTFVATPGGNPPLGVTNTLNAGDDLEATGAAAGNAVLQFSAIASAINPPFATDVIMNGVGTALITNNAAAVTKAGFTGNITGLTQVAASSVNPLSTIQLGTAAQGLNTALAQITLQTTEIFTAWMTAAALGGAKDAALVNLLGVGTMAGPDAVANLNVTTGTNGYETLTVNSAGGAGTANFLTLNTNATSTATIVETGANNLRIEGTALNIANLHTYNGKAGTGNQIVIFNGTGNVAATGGTGNDTFVFDNTGVGTGPTFTAASSVDGDGGVNELEIAATQGALLGTGVGPNITNIQVIEHRAGDGFPGMTGDLTVDMARSGSANELDLVGDYGRPGGTTVTVTDLTNAKTVLFEGFDLNNLVLQHTAGGFANVINFTMAADGETPQFTMGGDLVLNQLTVAAAPGLAALNILSTGTAPGDNIITNLSTNPVAAVPTVEVNVSIRGDHHLTFGSKDGAYAFIGGTVDASTDTGGVTTWFANTPNDSTATPPSTNPNVDNTFLGGPGNDTVHLLNFWTDVVNFTTGGMDTVDFHEPRNDNGASPLANVPGSAATTSLYNAVFGFTQANDTIDITNGPLMHDLAFTNDGPVMAGAATSILQYTTGAVINASALADNWIKIVTATSGAGQTVNQGFDSAIGAGTITTSANNFYLASYYDLTDSQAVFVTVDAHGGGHVIDTASTVDVVGLIHMSQADYAALTAANLTFLHV
jgi:hypothetical protein